MSASAHCGPPYFDIIEEQHTSACGGVEKRVEELLIGMEIHNPSKWGGKSLKDSLTYSVVIDSPHLGRDLVGAGLKLCWLMNRFRLPPLMLTCHDWCWVQLLNQWSPVWWPFGLVRWHRI